MGLARPGEPASERLHALVVPDVDALQARGAVNVRELLRYELEGQSIHLPAHKRVLSFDVRLEPLPRTTTGKLRRHEIQRTVEEKVRLTPDGRDLPGRREEPDRRGEPNGEPDRKEEVTGADRQWLGVADRAATAAAIAAHLGHRSVAPGANLELDLGLDSMERVELLTMLEHRAGGAVPAEVRARIFTVRQLIEAVEQAAPAGATAARTETASWATILSGDQTGAIRELDRGRVWRSVLFVVFIRSVRAIAALVTRFRVSGVEHLPRSGPLIICPNHQSFLDGFFVASALPFGVLQRIFFVGAAEYFQTSTMRWLARLANIVPVDPDANLMDAMQVSAAGLRTGHVLMLFPEGERTIDGQLRPFRKGAAILAAHLNAPLVPAALDGPFDLWPRGRPFNWRGILAGRARVSLRFGQPQRVATTDYAGAAAALQSAVAELLRQNREP